MNIATEFADEIIGRLANNPAVDREASLPLTVATLQKTFNAQLELHLDREDETHPTWRKLLRLDDCKIFADDETALLVKTFGATAGLFGLGVAGGNFKILSLCYTVTEDDNARAKLDLVFNAFVKTFLPKVPINEFIALLAANNFLTAAGTTFELVELGELNMLNVFVEPEEVIT